jgi:hypothetical protein
MEQSRRQENRVRRKAAREGYRVIKSRRVVDGWNNAGEFMLVDERGSPALGFRYDASLDDIETVVGRTVPLHSHGLGCLREWAKRQQG